MKDKTKLGTRIVEVHNGSSLFTGDAGGGESNLRRFIIENDLLEAIVAMPDKEFYNTPIATYIWIVTNRKELRRKGKVQLIDATSIKSPLLKNLGEKGCELSKENRDAILSILERFEEGYCSRILDNNEFGYWEVELFLPARDSDGERIKDKKGKIKLAKVRGEVEQIPLNYPGGIDGFYETEVKPYNPEIVFGEPKIGYNLSFSKYFYKPVTLRNIDVINNELIALRELETKYLSQIFE